MNPARDFVPALVRICALAAAACAGAHGAAPPAEEASAVELRPCDLLVYDATPAGVACAVRAAREGLAVLLVNHTAHWGGAMTNGLSTMDTLYNGARAPVYDELRRQINEHYRSIYGADSVQYRLSQPDQPKTKYEASVVERLIDRMVLAEPRITTLNNCFPTRVKRDGRLLREVIFQERGSARRFSVAARIYADCSYEGDLMAAAHVAYRVGREARSEFGEAHAGRIFMRRTSWPPPGVSAEELAGFRGLNLAHYNRWYVTIEPQSTGAADGAVQAYGMRTVVTCDPADRVPVEQPPGYDADTLRRRLKTDVLWSTRPPVAFLPNRKSYLNLPEIVGSQQPYVEGDWEERGKVTQENVRLTCALIYFMQHDPSVPERTRAGWQAWGLPRDEFVDNGHVPYEIYVREARRLEGRSTFTENDAHDASALRRSPVRPDSISVTDWFLDSHACTPERGPAGSWEGVLALGDTVPGQIPYRALLPRGVDNLLVPVCASSSHVGWGAIRLEPTWMSLGEAAGWAAKLSLRDHREPGTLEPDELVRTLADHRVMVSFFNDVEVDPREPWYGSVQYFGTQGFFGTFEARPLAALDEVLAEAWAKAFVEWRTRKPVDATARARAMMTAEKAGGMPLTVQEFTALLARTAKEAGLPFSQNAAIAAIHAERDMRMSRGSACRIMYALAESGERPSTE